MEEVIRREFWIPKITPLFGVFAGCCSLFGAGLGFGSGYTAAHFAVSLCYMLLAVLVTRYCIRRRLRAALTVSALHWSAVLLLTLPAFLGECGVLEMNPTGGYTVLVLLLDGAMLGLEAYLFRAAAYAVFLLFAAAELVLASVGLWQPYHPGK